MRNAHPLPFLAAGLLLPTPAGLLVLLPCDGAAPLTVCAGLEDGLGLVVVLGTGAGGGGGGAVVVGGGGAGTDET